MLFQGLLTPSAPPRTEILEDESARFSIVQTNGMLQGSDLLDAGTPPPSYAEALASISDSSNEPEGVIQTQVAGE